MNESGLIHVLTGNGRGKTTSALGLALRAAGRGLKVYIIQFMKGEDTGEVFAIRKYLQNITITPYGIIALKDQQKRMHQFDEKIKTVTKRKYYFFPSDKHEEEPSRRAMEHAFHTVKSGGYDLVILDEINCVLDKKIIPLEAVIKLINEKPRHVELVFTGRGAPKELIEKADYVSEVKEIKHPFERGVLARKGIEY